MSDNTNNGFPVPEEPLTREEQYLSAIAGVTAASDIPEKPLTRVEAYLDKIVKNGGGGGGGTTNYNALENKPQINGTTLSGDKSSSDLGLQDTISFEGTYDSSNNKAATMAAIKDGKLTGYAQTSGNVAATDKVIEAIGKIEKKADDNQSNISLIDHAIGTKLYFSETQPTGTIPTGSYWISTTGNMVYGGNVTYTTFPQTIKFDSITAYTIIGNMSQSGTPTPECGDKTANLFDVNATDTSNGYIDGAYLASDGTTYAPQGSGASVTEYIPVNASQVYSQSKFYTGSSRTPAICFYDSAKNYISGIIIVDNPSFTTPSSALYVRISRTKSNTESMLNSGSTSLAYEPYGYKIPILLGSNTYPIYISEPLRKSLDSSNVYDTIESNGTLTRRVDANGDALATPTTEQITVPTLLTTGTAEQFDVDTTLKPSAVTLTVTGWN